MIIRKPELKEIVFGLWLQKTPQLLFFMQQLNRTTG